jgi:hypothetical protein
VADETGCHSRAEEMAAYLERGRNLNQMHGWPNCNLRGNIQPSEA